MVPVIYFLASVLCLATASPAAISNSGQTSKSANLILPNNALTQVSANLPPPGFSIRSERTTPPETLTDIECFAVTTFVLSHLAAETWTTSIPSRAYIAPGHYGLSLILLGGPESPHLMRTDYLTWGLTLAIKNMVDHQNFQNMRFSLEWQNRQVGLIEFRATIYHNVNEANTTQDPMIRISGQSSTLESVPSVGASDVNVRVKEKDGELMKAHDVFMAIVGGLRDIAPFDMSAEVSTREHGSSKFVSTFEPYNAEFILRAISGVYTPQPDWCTYEVSILQNSPPFFVPKHPLGPTDDLQSAEPVALQGLWVLRMYLD